MLVNQIPVLGIILGDHAGSSPEMAAKAVLAAKGCYIPVFTGNLERFQISCQHVEGAERLQIRPLEGRPSEGGEDIVYFCDIPAGPDIHFSTVTADSGKLMYDSMVKMIELERAGIVDGFSMAPIQKRASMPQVCPTTRNLSCLRICMEWRTFLLLSNVRMYFAPP